jgi:hypothetical protein
MTINRSSSFPEPTGSTAPAEGVSQRELLTSSGPRADFQPGNLRLTTKYDDQINAQLGNIAAIGAKYTDLENENLPSPAAQMQTARDTYGSLFTTAQYHSAQASQGYSGGAKLQTWEKLLAREVATTVNLVEQNYDTNKLNKGTVYSFNDESGQTWKFTVEQRLGRDRIFVWDPSGKQVLADLTRNTEGNLKGGSTTRDQSEEAVRYLRILQKALRDQRPLTPVAVVT